MARNKMDVMEILEKCLTNDRFKRATEKSKIEIKDFKWSVTECYLVKIHLTPAKPNEPEIKIDLTYLPTPNAKKYVINGTEVMAERRARNFLIHCEFCEEDNKELLDDVTKFLLEIMTVENFHVESEIFPDVVFNYSKKFKTFTIGSDLCAVVLKTNEVKYLFEEIEVDVFKMDRAKVRALTTMKKYRLKYREMELAPRNWDWFSFKSILNMECERLTIKSAIYNSTNEIKMKDVTEFVKIWMKEKPGVLRKFRQLRIESNVFKKFTTWDNKGQPKKFAETLKALGATDILHRDPCISFKRADGMKARLYWDSTSIYFNVIDK